MKKIKFLRKLKFYMKNHIFRGGSWKCQRATNGTPRSTTSRGGAAGIWPRQLVAWGPQAPPLALSPSLASLLPEKSLLHISNSCSCCSFPVISISTFSQFLLLKFGASPLRYVTPPNIQVEFCLMVYI